MNAPEPNLARSALLILDLQEDFLQATGALRGVGLQPLEARDREALLANCRQLTTAVRRAGRPVIYLQTVFRGDMADCFFPPKWLRRLDSSAPVLVKGSPGAALPTEIALQEGDFCLDKKGLCAFQFTYLDRLLRGLDVDTCILSGFCGVAGGIDETARMGSLLGYDNVIAADAVFPLRSPHLKTLSNEAAVKDTREITSLLRAENNRAATKSLIPALILVAMNNDGCHPLGSKYRYRITAHGAELPEEERRLYISNNNRLIAAMSSNGFPVIHAQTGVRLDKTDDAHSKENARVRGTERVQKFPPGIGYMIEGTWGAEILEGVKLPEGYYRVPKKGNSAFGLTHLSRLLRNLEVNLCIVTGDATTGCISSTVRQGAALGYEIIVVSDATVRANIPYHDVLANRVEVQSTDEVLAFLAGLPERRRSTVESQ
jgi:nicotinamidase-related amidase